MSDRRLWLAEPCPTCCARVGLRCQTSRYAGKPSRVLHGARGWRHRSCPSCKAQPGERCRTPTGRQAAGPHTARLSYGPRELFAEEDVWQELARWAASAALVRFSGGGGHTGGLAAVTLEDAGKKELARWGNGEGELPEALAAPIWGRYALFRGHPRITGLVMWDAQEREVVVTGERGGEKFDEVLSAPRPVRLAAVPAPPTTARDTSPGPAAQADRQASLPADGAGEFSRVCEHCGEPLGAGLRPEAKFCSKRCRQAASRERLKRQPSKPPSPPPERCSWCGGAMPAGLRAEARFCSKRCRQASSRHALKPEGAEASRTRAGGAAAMKLAGVQAGDLVRCAINGRAGIYGEVTEIKDGIVYFRPLCRATGWRHASAREVVGHWRKAGRRGEDDNAPAIPRAVPVIWKPKDGKERTAMNIEQAFDEAAHASDARLRKSYEVALAHGATNTACRPDEERLYGTLRLVTLAILRLPDLAMIAQLMHMDSEDRIVLRAACEVAGGALRLAHRHVRRAIRKRRGKR